MQTTFTPDMGGAYGGLVRPVPTAEDEAAAEVYANRIFDTLLLVIVKSTREDLADGYTAAESRAFLMGEVSSIAELLHFNDDQAVLFGRVIETVISHVQAYVAANPPPAV